MKKNIYFAGETVARIIVIVTLTCLLVHCNSEKQSVCSCQCKCTANTEPGADTQSPKNVEPVRENSDQGGTDAGGDPQKATGSVNDKEKETFTPPTSPSQQLASGDAEDEALPTPAPAKEKSKEGKAENPSPKKNQTTPPKSNAKKSGGIPPEGYAETLVDETVGVEFSWRSKDRVWYSDRLRKHLVKGDEKQHASFCRILTKNSRGVGIDFIPSGWAFQPLTDGIGIIIAPESVDVAKISITADSSQGVVKEKGKKGKSEPAVAATGDETETKTVTGKANDGEKPTDDAVHQAKSSADEPAIAPSKPAVVAVSESTAKPVTRLPDGRSPVSSNWNQTQPNKGGHNTYSPWEVNGKYVQGPHNGGKNPTIHISERIEVTQERVQSTPASPEHWQAEQSSGSLSSDPPGKTDGLGKRMVKGVKQIIPSLGKRKKDAKRAQNKGQLIQAVPVTE